MKFLSRTIVFLFLAIVGILCNKPVQAQSIIYKNPPGTEYLQRWLICGPFPIPSATPETIHDPKLARSRRGNIFQKAGFEFDYLTERGGEVAIRPEAEMTHRYEGEEYAWKYFESSRRIVNLLEVFGRVEIKELIRKDPNGRNRYRTEVKRIDNGIRTDNTVTYAYATVEMAEAKQMIIAVGSDDAVKVWLNGECIHSHWTMRGVEIDTDMFDGVFVKGTNHLLLKVLNGEVDYGFSCRILTQGEAPLSYVLDRQFDFDESADNASKETHIPSAWDWLSALIPLTVLLIFLVIFYKRIIRR